MRRVYPVPELVIDEMVRVDDTGKATEGSMDNDARIMRVPLLDTPACRHVRAHEMAHAKYSPKAPTVPRGTTAQIVQRVEDMRMNNLCRTQGLDEAMDASIIPDSDTWRRILTDKAAALTAGISCYDTGDWKDWVMRAKPSTDDIELIQSLWDEISETPTWGQTQALAQQVAKYLDIPESYEEELGEGGEGMEGTPMDFSGDPIDKLVDKSLEEEAARESMTPFEKGLDALENQKERFKGLSGRSRADILKDGEVKINTLPLTRRMAASKFKSRAKVAADRGMVPKYMNRYCTDKAVFIGRGRKRDNGGTIIIDASGSMSIESEDVDQAMNLAPLGTIATYSGQGRRGEIRVIAKGGKRAVGGDGDASLRPRYYGNLVDVNALEWAIKQPGPYYWVCDCVVSGGDPKGESGEVFGANIFDRCIELVEKYGIIIVPDLDSLPEIMRKTL